MPRVAVIGAAGAAGRRHTSTFDGAGWSLDCVETGDDWRKAVEAADVVSICTPDNLHAEMTIFALEAGKHVICEKPLTHQFIELAEIEECVRRHDGQTFSTNFPLRHHLAVIALTDLLREDDRPYFLDGMYNRGRLANMKSGWRGRMHGYSLFCGGGIHVADIMLASRGGKITPLKRASVGPEDSWDRLAIAEYLDAGSLCRITCNFGYEGIHCVTVSAFWPNSMDRVEIYGEEHYDKSADIRAFIAAVEHDLPGNGADAIRANRLCLDLETAWD